MYVTYMVRTVKMKVLYETEIVSMGTWKRYHIIQNDGSYVWFFTEKFQSPLYCSEGRNLGGRQRVRGYYFGFTV